MDSALDSGSSVMGSTSGQGHVLCWPRHFTLTAALSSQVYKWALVN